jgi:hypothetical protein
MGWVVTSRPGRFTHGERKPVPIVQEAGWATGPAWTVAENIVRTGIRSPDRPALSESLHRLRYSGPLFLELELQPFKRRVKSHMPFAGIIRSSPYNPR